MYGQPIQAQRFGTRFAGSRFQSMGVNVRSAIVPVGPTVLPVSPTFVYPPSAIIPPVSAPVYVTAPTDATQPVLVAAIAVGLLALVSGIL